MLRYILSILFYIFGIKEYTSESVSKSESISKNVSVSRQPETYIIQNDDYYQIGLYFDESDGGVQLW